MSERIPRIGPTMALFPFVLLLVGMLLTLGYLLGYAGGLYQAREEFKAAQRQLDLHTRDAEPEAP
jgi:hypothetical protein